MSFLSRLFGKQAQKPEPVKIVQTPAFGRPSAPPAPNKAPEPVPAPKTYRVAGVTHYQENILSMAITNYDYQLSKRELIDEGLMEKRIYEYDFDPLKAELVPEPDNPQDPKAIKVLVDGLHVGYIKSGSCSHLLKVIREGRIKKIDVEMGGGKYKYLDVVDYKENGDEIYAIDRGDVPLFVHLSITEAEKPEA